jgi:hypothetical protein
MLDHPEDAREMGLRGRERVRSHFARKVMCDALDELYSELLGLPSTAGDRQSAVGGHTGEVLRSA